MRTRAVDCATCNGDGEDQHGRRCPACNGSGDEEIEDLAAYEIEDLDERCGEAAP